MILRISDIENEVTLKGAIEGEKLAAVEGDRDVAFPTPAEYRLTVRKNAEIVTVSGEVTCEITLTCSKCLEEFSTPVKGFLDIELAPKALMPSASEWELKGEDLDTYYYEGDEIDLDRFVYEEIMLNVPIKPVCGEDCEGLCGECGGNRNYNECRCKGVSHTLLGEKLKSFLN